MSVELTRLSIAGALDGLRTRAFSASELAEAHIGKMESASSLALKARVLRPSRAPAIDRRVSSTLIPRPLAP